HAAVDESTPGKNERIIRLAARPMEESSPRSNGELQQQLVRGQPTCGSRIAHEKRYLFGQRLPMTWEGWLVDAVWCACFLGLSPWLRKDSQHPLWALGLFFGLIAVFMAIRSWKGAPQRWDD
ncbi:MAG: hypothetical protein WCB11_00830, partial [Terriglobales bacterium]